MILAFSACLLAIGSWWCIDITGETYTTVLAVVLLWTNCCFFGFILEVS